MISISTCWNYSPDMDLYAWLKLAKTLGFDAVELDYNFTRAHLSALPEMLAKLHLKVSSVHNFCPVPDDAPSPRHKSNYYRLSSVDEDERRRAVTWTKSTIDTAVRLGAKAVVVHAGAVEFEDDRSTPLRDLYTQGKKGTEEYAAELERVLSGRKNHRAPYVEAVEKSLQEILTYSHQRGRVLGFESRYYPLEIPNFTEIGHFLERFHSRGLFYWHDMGHSQMSENLGITPNLDFLRAYGDRMIGMHIHDMKGLKDHQAPLTGEIDMKPFVPYFCKTPLKVFEVKNATCEQLRDSLNAFKRLCAGN